MQSINFGKALLSINARGCVQCGSEFSSGWRVARTIEVRVENRKPIAVDLHICADCGKKEGEHHE